MAKFKNIKPTLNTDLKAYVQNVGDRIINIFDLKKFLFDGYVTEYGFGEMQFFPNDNIVQFYGDYDHTKITFSGSDTGKREITFSDLNPETDFVIFTPITSDTHPTLTFSLLQTVPNVLSLSTYVNDSAWGFSSFYFNIIVRRKL